MGDCLYLTPGEYENEVIEISETALNVLSEGLQASGIKSHEGLRLNEKDDQLILDLDTPKQGDRIICSQDRQVLFIAPEVEANLGNAIIDIENTTGGLDIVLRIKNIE